MRRLTPDKIYGYGNLPDSKLRINKGNTSVIYKTDDPNILEMFTVESVKCEWFARGLDIIEDWDYVADAVYTGYDGYTANRQHRRILLPVYRCLVQRLDTPNTAQMKRIRQIQKAINGIGFMPGWNLKSDYELRLWRWNQIEALGIPEIATSIEFVRDCGYDYYVNPDYGVGDFMIQNGQIVPLDPFHHEDVNEVFRLHD